MSYDVEIEFKLPDGKWIPNGTFYSYTWNCSPMFHQAIKRHPEVPRFPRNKDEMTEIETGIYGLADMEASSAIPILNGAIIFFIENKESLEKLNPENGFGNYEGALKFLKKILDLCIEYPYGIVRAE